MEYGGSDVSRLFHSLLARCGVALPELNLAHSADVIQMQALKETCCHLNQVILKLLFILQSVEI